MRTTSSGFTLIELLVVISIIAVLAAMLIPAISMVRDAARSANCRSNLREFGLAFEGYVGEQDGFYPDFQWQEKLQNYINSEGKIVMYFDGSQPTLEFKPARCPSAPKKNLNGWPISVSYSYVGVYWKSWTMVEPSPPPGPQNYWKHFAWRVWVGASVDQTFPIVHSAQVVRSTEKCLLSEHWNDGNARQNWGSDELNDQKARQMHAGRANFLFVDGHVSSIPVDAPGPLQFKQWAYDPMWLPRYNVASTRVK